MSFIESYYKNTSFDDLKAGIAVYNPKDMSIDTLNDTFATIHGYDVDELIGMPVENLFISKHMHLFQVKEKKFEVSMEDSVYETLHRKKDGSTFSVFVQITAIKDENGNIKQKILNVTDISRYKKAWQELKKHKLEYRALSENIPDAVVRYDMDIRRVYVNKEWERINGISSDEAIGKTPIELSGVISHQAKEFHKKLKNVVKHEKSDEWDFEFLNLYGNVNCYSVRAVPEYNELGKVTGILTTARDITQRKELEEEKISEQMRSYFESQLVGMAITSPQKKWLRVNKKLSSMLGYTYSELKSMTWEEITHPDDLNGEVEEYTKMLNGEIDEYIYEKRFIHKNGTMLFAKLLVSCVRNNDQSVDYVLTLIEDITGSVCSLDAQFDLNSSLEKRIKDRINELQIVNSKLDMEVAGRKHVQRQLTSREQLFTSVMENLPGFVFKYRLMPDGKEEFLYASKGIYDVYGVTSETALSNISAVREVIHPQDIKSFRDAIEESARTLEVLDVEFRVLHREKGELWLESRSTPQKQDDGSIVWHGITIDITERKEAEKLLKKREFEFHSLAENLPYNIARFDTEGRYLYINPTHERLLGMTLSEAIGTFIPESHTEVKAAIAQAVATKEKVTIQQKVPGESGEIEIHDVSITPEFGENKEVVSVLGIGRDITEAKRKEIEYRTLTENSPDVIVRYDCNLKRVYVNKAWEHVNNATRDDVIGKSLTERSWVISKVLSSYEQFLKSIIKTGETADTEFSIVDKNGKTIYFNLKGVPEFDSDGKVIGVLTVARDITERKVIEEQLLEQNQFLDSLHNAIPVPVFYKDTETRYKGFNNAFEEFYGKKKEDLIGKGVFDIFPPEQAQVFFDADAELFRNGGTQIYETKLKDARGVNHDVMFHKSVYFDQKGMVAGQIGTILDITERKLMEDTLEKNRASLAEAQRVSHTGSWELNFETNELSWSDEVYRIFEIDKNEFSPSYEAFLQAIHPDDKYMVNQVFTESLEEQTTYEIEHRLLMSDGRVKHVLERGETQYSDEGKPLSTLGIVHDITERKEMEELLRKKELEFRTIMENTADTVARYDKECVRTYANPSFAKMAGKSVDELLGKTPTYYFDTPQGREYEKAIKRVYDSGIKEEFEFSWQGAEGSVITSLISLVPESDNTGVIQNVLATGRDITKLKKFENEIKKQNNFHESLLEGIANIGLTLSVLEEGRFIYTNNHKEAKKYGYDSEKLSETRPSLLTTIHQQDREKVMQMYEKRLRGEEVPNRYTVRVVKSDGDIREEELSVVLVPNTDPVQTIVVTKDVTKKLENERKVKFLAHHDVLTGLPNRTLIKEKVYRSLEEANEKRVQVAILFIDLDGFKAVNDSLGHSAGDDMLKMVASRLAECIDTKDIISRQGGDEFLVVLPDIQDINDVVKSADKLVNAFTRPFTLRNQVISTSASIGIALYPDHGNDFEQLLQCSDAAMYKAKEAGKNSFCFFTQRMKNEILVQFQMQNDLKDAVKNKEFILHYQPQVDIKENKIIGAEALLRWEHPKHGMIPPNSFIPIAESSSLIVEIGEWVIMEACRQAAIWNAQGKDITVAVNISAVQFKKGNLEDVVKRALYLSGLEPRYLELELTESILINNTESVLQTVKVIKELEIQLSIDDFGTGYSSLSYLKRFAVDKLKIDQSFVRDIINDNENASIVRTIIQMAKSFNLSSIAEGVEDENVLALVKEFGCDEVQGYHFAKPMIVDDFEDYYMSFNK